MKWLIAIGIFLSVLLIFTLIGYIFFEFIDPHVDIKALSDFKVILILAHLAVISGIYAAWKYFKGKSPLDYSHIINKRKKGDS